MLLFGVSSGAVVVLVMTSVICLQSFAILCAGLGSVCESRMDLGTAEEYYIRADKCVVIVPHENPHPYRRHTLDKTLFYFSHNNVIV